MPKKISIGFLILTCLMAGPGCKKDFTTINTDPGKIPLSQINFTTLFTNAQLVTSGNSDANGFEDWRNNLIYSGSVIQHLSSTFSYWVGDKYLYSATYNSAYWDKNYPNSIANIVDVVEHIKTDTAQFNFYQIARIFKAFMFQRMTDMYGDCPYSEAGLGYISKITRPKYDKQRDIYLDLLHELQDAAISLDASRPNTVGPADLLYGGAPDAWKKFAYSEMVRIAMRLSKAEPDTAEKWVKIAVQGGVMKGNSDNAIVQHQNLSGTPVPNGTGLVLIGNAPNDYRLSETFVNYLKASDDPRLPYLATVCADPSIVSAKGDTAFDHQLGQPNGYDPPNSGSAYDLVLAPGWPGNQNSYSVVNRYTFARLDAPSFLLTFGETGLLLAEAAQRGWIGGTPGDFFSAGVKGAMQQLAAQAGAGPADSLIGNWLLHHPYDPALAFQQINEQYWIAGFMDENECFANWRRSNFPALIPVNYPGNITNGTIPRRFTYPVGEAATNTTHYNEAVSGLDKGDKMTSRVWWDRP